MYIHFGATQIDGADQATATDVSRLFNLLAIVCWFVVGGCCCSSSSVANPCKFNNIIFSSDIVYRSQRDRVKGEGKERQ